MLSGKAETMKEAVRPDTNLVVDEASTEGKIYCANCIHCKLVPAPAGQGRYYLRVRCDAKTDAGAAMTVGVYDDARRQSVVSRAIPVQAIRGKQYQSIDLGVLALGEQMYVWAAPVVRNQDEVEAVYVDRVFLVRTRQEGP